MGQEVGQLLGSERWALIQVSFSAPQPWLLSTPRSHSGLGGPGLPGYEGISSRLGSKSACKSEWGHRERG